MNCECACIAPHLGGIPDILSKTNLPYLVNYDDDDAYIQCVTDLFNNPEKRCAIGQANRKHTFEYFNYLDNNKNL
jgi:hypothetical protein